MTTRTIPSSDAAIDPIEAAKQIAEKAANQRMSIEAERQTAQDRLDAATSELHTLSEAVQARTAHLTQAESNATRLEQEWQQAKRYAELATDTIGAQQALKDALEAEGHAKRARQEHERILAEVTQQNEQAVIQIGKLNKEIAEMHTTIDGTGPRLAEVTQVEQLAKRKLGESLHEAFLKERADHARNVQDARTGLIEAQMAEHSFLMEKLDELAPWADLQEDVLVQLPVDDCNTRAMRTTIAQLDSLLTNRLGLTPYLRESPDANRLGARWNEILFVGAEIFNMTPLNSERSGPRLQQQRDFVATVLTAYEQSKRRNRQR